MNIGSNNSFSNSHFVWLPTVDSAMEKLKELGPSAIDAELRQLGPDAGGSVELLTDFLAMLNHRLHSNRDFELIQAYLGLFLKVRGTSCHIETHAQWI